MNVWRCDALTCGRECVGVGGAVGLRAIGWYFTYGGPIFCPAHRPDPVKCLESDQESCELCAGEIEADLWQAIIGREYGFPERAPRAERLS
jgi:hypothetical protein